MRKTASDISPKRGRKAKLPDPEFNAKLERFYSAFRAKDKAELAPFLDVTPESIQHQITKQNIPEIWFVRAFEQGISSDWLLSGEGQMRRRHMPIADRRQSGPGSFSERLLWLISEKAKAKPADFARAAGIPPVLIHAYVNGSQKISPEHLTGIKETYGISPEWLLNGKGEPFLTDIETGVAHQGDYIYEAPEPDYGASKSYTALRSIDKKLLQIVLEALENSLRENERTITPGQKAEWIIFLYEEGLAAGHGAKEKITSRLKLVL
jgi:plasmid maintenance system antidote protein VapI